MTRANSSRRGKPDQLIDRRRSESWLLRERLKELNCLYMISRVFDRRSWTPAETMQAVADLIPPAWQHVDVAAACVTWAERRFASFGYRETAWEQRCPLIVRGQEVGSVSVVYLEERPELDEGPFLVEERKLLNTIAQRLGGYIEREQAQEQFLTYQENLRSLTAELSLSDQRERRRLAENLHDRIGQSLALITMKVGQLKQDVAGTELSEALSEIQRLTVQVIADTRSLTFELCPPILYELGLGPALEWLAETSGKTYGLDVQASTEGDLDGLSEELRFTLFQAVGELLANAGKHAQARRVTMHVTARADSVRVVVDDDGCGFDAAQLGSKLGNHLGFGLFNMRERLSHLRGGMQIDSHPGGGTRVTLVAPRDGYIALPGVQS